MLLAIDTATQMLSIALHDGAELVAELTLKPVRPHTVELAPLIDETLARTGTAREALSLLAVTVGPGTYSGLRVGVSLAKGLASALDCPLIGVTTLAITAAGQPNVRGDLIAVATAGRARITAQRFAWNKRGWQPQGEPSNSRWDELLPTLDTPVVLCGEIDADARAQIEAAQASGQPITLSTAGWRLRRAGWLAEVAWGRVREVEKRFEEDERSEALKAAFPAALVNPVYVQTTNLPEA